MRPAGSSPLTRGKHLRRSDRRDRRRLIPAHAGKTIPQRKSGMHTRAHPRSRGENLLGDVSADIDQGSSPLTRGKPSRRCQRRHRSGLIPAHAGKTPQTHGGSTHGWAHPRSRGENNIRTAFRIGPEGSSPLTRGKHQDAAVEMDPAGLIPAHAGKTRVSERRVERQGAHPRSRGENLRTTRPCFRQVGSSPLTRGKLLVALSACDAGGLIPAHAGKTPRAHQHRPRPRAHPRSRGENTTVGTMPGAGPGSSPLTRGKQQADNLDFL